MHYLIIFFFTDLDLAFSLRVVNCSRNPLVLKGKFDFENGLTSSWRIISLLLTQMYNYRLVYISCSCVYFTPQYLGVNLFLYIHMFMYISIFLAIHIYICLCMCKLWHFCWVYVEDNEGQEANKNSFFSVSFPGCSHLPFPGCLWVRSPPIVTSTGSMGFMRFFRLETCKVGRKMLPITGIKK